MPPNNQQTKSEEKRTSWNKGIPMSDSIKKKISLKLSGKKRPEHSKFMKNNNPFKGKIHSEKTKEVMRNLSIGRPSGNLGNKYSEYTKQIMSEMAKKRILELNGNWRGGKSVAKRRALERDNFKCRICGEDDIVVLEVDHILPKSTHPQIMYDIDNLMTLCANCHIRKTKYERKTKAYAR